MTVNDVLKITTSYVVVMDRDTVYQIIAKFKGNITEISVNYDKQDVLSSTIINIQASDGIILLTV